MRPPVAPVYAEPRILSPRAIVMLGLAGTMVAIAVITATYTTTAPAAGRPAVHATASPAMSPAGR